VVTTGTDRTLRFWDAKSGSPREPQARLPDDVIAVAFNSQGTRFVTTHSAGWAQQWNAQSGQSIGLTMTHDEIHSVCFSPDSTRILTASRDHTARLWDAETGAPLGETMRHGGAILSIAFSADGLAVVTSSGDRTARLWEAHTGVALGSPMRHDEPVNSASFSPDGSQILTASSNAARRWNGQELLNELAQKDDAVRLLGLAMAGEALNKDTFQRLDPPDRLMAANDLLSDPAWLTYQKAVHGRLRPQHQTDADEAERSGDYFAAAWHLERLVKENPGDAALKTRLQTARQKWTEQKPE
jgi:hypothetical protein